MAARVSARILVRKLWRPAFVAMFAEIESTVPASRASMGATSAAAELALASPVGNGNAGSPADGAEATPRAGRGSRAAFLF
eukprot:6456780-Alexandrium_andersonii.AAC.1